MKNSIIMLAAASVISLAPAAHAADASQQSNTKMLTKDNGGYESTNSSEKVNADGSKIQSDSTTDLSIDKNGLAKKTTENDTTVSNGMGHRKDEATKTEYTQKENGGYRQVTTSKHTNTDGTDTTMVTTTDVDVDKDGNTTTVAKTEKTVDPKGLMNKTTTSTETKSVNGAVVESEKKTK